MRFDDDEDEDGEELDEDFPLGDGDADTAAEVECPCCGAVSEIGLDPGGGSSQEYVEDCEVCCRPWLVRVRYQDDGSAEVQLAPADE
jgi:hypothetical protein